MIWIIFGLVGNDPIF